MQWGTLLNISPALAGMSSANANAICSEAGKRRGVRPNRPRQRPRHVSRLKRKNRCQSENRPISRNKQYNRLREVFKDTKSN